MLNPLARWPSQTFPLCTNASGFDMLQPPGADHHNTESCCFAGSWPCFLPWYRILLGRLGRKVSCFGLPTARITGISYHDQQFLSSFTSVLRYRCLDLCTNYLLQLIVFLRTGTCLFLGLEEEERQANRRKERKKRSICISAKNRTRRLMQRAAEAAWINDRVAL